MLGFCFNFVSLVAQTVKKLSAVQMRVRSLGREDPLEKETGTHSSILAWKIPWAEEPGTLQSMGSQESDTTEPITHTVYIISKKISKTTHREILSEEEFFGEFYAYPFSDCPSNMYTNEVGNSSEYSSDSDNVNIRPQKDKKNLSD